MIKKGDWVVCIEKSQYPDCDGEVGQVYQVRNIDHTHIWLVDQKASVALASRRFRHIDESNLPQALQKINERMEKKQEMKKVLDELKKKLHTLEKIYNEM